jgi:hypothetical protein
VTKEQFSEALLSQARGVLNYSQTLAEEVRDRAAFKVYELAAGTPRKATSGSVRLIRSKLSRFAT